MKKWIARVLLGVLCLEMVGPMPYRNACAEMEMQVSEVTWTDEEKNSDFQKKYMDDTDAITGCLPEEAVDACLKRPWMQ